MSAVYEKFAIGSKLLLILQIWCICFLSKKDH